MSQVQKVAIYTEYRAKIVEPDYRDFLQNDGDLRAAFHCAISLFHLADWVYAHHKSYIDKNFTFVTAGRPLPVSDEKMFANALADHCSDFELIRGVANSAKHLTLKPRNAKRPAAPSNMPSHAANTVAESPGWDQAKWDQDKWDSTPTVKLEGASGNHLVLSDVATNVRVMWDALFLRHGW